MGRVRFGVWIPWWLAIPLAILWVLGLILYAAVWLTVKFLAVIFGAIGDWAELMAAHEAVRRRHAEEQRCQNSSGAASAEPMETHSR